MPIVKFFMTICFKIFVFHIIANSFIELRVSVILVKYYTKQFIAVAIMKLQEKNLLNVQDNLNK